MNIGVLGSGNMARAVGGAWAAAGHAVMFGSRDPDKGRAVAAEVGHAARGGRNADAAGFGEVVLLTARVLPSELLPDAGVLAGKAVVDCNNRPVPDGLVFGPPELPSFAERVAADVPAGRVVKALNTMAMEAFDHPADQLRPHRAAAFVAGDDADAKRAVGRLMGDLGLVPVDIGPLAHAWMAEAMGDVIRHVIIGQQRWTATFGLAEPPPARPRFGGRRDGYR